MFLKKGIGFSIGICLISVAVAGAEGGLTLTDSVFQKIEKKGSRTLRTIVPLQEVKPGEEVSQLLTYSNTGENPVKEVTLTAPVPEALEYISTSIIKTGETDASFDVSLNGGKEYGVLSELTVMAPNGESRRAKAYDVTHVRWMLKSSVAAKEEVHMLLRGRMKAPAPALSPPLPP